jgi:drug/metabolite transporter (DMT)-like permease
MVAGIRSGNDPPALHFQRGSRMMSVLILLRVILSVSAGAVQKRLLLDGIRLVPLWLGSYLLMLVPALLLSKTELRGVSAEFWGNALMGGILDAIGNLAMAAALRSADLSVFGPLNAFRPVLAMVFGWLMLGEAPSWLGAGGVGFTVIGAAVLLGGIKSGRSDGRKGGLVIGVLAFRLLGLSLSTAGAVFLKRAALIGSAEVTLAGWIGCGAFCLGIVLVARGTAARTFAEQVHGHRFWLVIHTVAFFVMQWLTIRIFQSTLLAYSFAYFQLAMVLQVAAGHLVFKEPGLCRRMSACLLMCAGSGLVAWRG